MLIITFKTPEFANLPQNPYNYDSGVANFAVYGVSDKDWHLVKQMSESYPSVIPCFGVHQTFVPERSSIWFTILRLYFESTPSAAIGEIGLDKGSMGKLIDFDLQIEVFTKQLELAKELKRPASVHCVCAFGDLLDIMKETGPFLEGVILHCYLGSAEIVTNVENECIDKQFNSHQIDSFIF